MSRTDEVLYTGITSVSSEPKTPREAQKLETERAKQKLKPAYDYVYDLLEVEKKALFDMRTLVFDTQTTPDELRIERILRMRHEALINKLQAKLKNIMKDKK